MQRRSRHVTVPVIRSHADLGRALAEVNALMERGTLVQADEDRLNSMAVLVEAYEREHFPIGPPDPVEAIKFRLEQLGFETPSAQAKALEPIMGSRARVHEVMHRTRGLSPRMVNGLWKKFEIPLEVLITGMLASKKAKKPRKKPRMNRRAEPRQMANSARAAKKMSHRRRRVATG